MRPPPRPGLRRARARGPESEGVARVRPERLRTGSRAHPGSRPEKGGGASCPACSCGSPASRGRTLAPSPDALVQECARAACPAGQMCRPEGALPLGGRGSGPASRAAGRCGVLSDLRRAVLHRQVCVLEAGRAATLNVKRGPSAPRRCRGAARGLGSPDAVSLDDVGTASTFAQPLPRGNSEWAPEEATGRGRGKARAGNGERGIPSTQNWSFLRQGSSGVSSRECGR